MGSLCWKLLAVAPALLASLVVGSLIHGLLPVWAQPLWLLGGATAIGASQTRVGERSLAWLVHGARGLRPGEQAALADAITRLCAQKMGPPLVEVRVVAHPSWAPGGFGRRTLLASDQMIIALRRGNLSLDEAVALLVAGVGMAHSPINRWDGLIAALTLPWLPLRAIFGGIAQAMQLVPLVWFAWRIRVVVIGIAIWQQAAAGRIWLTAGVATVGAISYLAPLAASRLNRALQLAGDDFAAANGHTTGLTRYLRRFPGDDFAVQRLHRLAPPTPHLSLAR